MGRLRCCPCVAGAFPRLRSPLGTPYGGDRLGPAICRFSRVRLAGPKRISFRTAAHTRQALPPTPGRIPTRKSTSSPPMYSVPTSKTYNHHRGHSCRPCVITRLVPCSAGNSPSPRAPILSNRVRWSRTPTFFHPGGRRLRI